MGTVGSVAGESDFRRLIFAVGSRGDGRLQWPSLFLLAANMSYSLSRSEHQATLKLSNHQRFQHFVDKVAEHGEIWSLANADGWVTLTSEGDNCLPVWPHPDYAAEWATGDWADCQPKSVPLAQWLERWTKGLTADETLLVVFPNLKEEALLAEPGELDEALREALE